MASSWRENVTRGARLLWLSPMVALSLAPVAVFFRPALVALALSHLYGVWQFTAGGAPAPTSLLKRSAWLLRALALAGAATVIVNYEAYRALLIASVAACLAYQSELAPALELRPKKELRWAAWAAALCCAVAAVDLALRHGSNWPSSGWTPAHVASLLAIPLGALAWLELDRARAAGVDEGPGRGWGSVRAFAVGLSEIILPFALGAGVVALSVFTGVWFSWGFTDFEPGVMRAAILFCLSCLNGACLLGLRRLSRGTWRRAIVGAALLQVPVWWLGVFPTQFDSPRWKRSPPGSEARSDMAEDLIYSRTLLGKTRAEVRQLLGPPEAYLPVQPSDDKEYHSLAGRPCKGFLITFDDSSAVRAEFYFCDD